LTSLYWRDLLNFNKKSLTHLTLQYKNDTVREESRILLEEFGLESFTNLTHLTLNMNRNNHFDSLLRYLKNEDSPLTSLNLAENNLNGLNCK